MKIYLSRMTSTQKLEILLSLASWSNLLRILSTITVICLYLCSQNELWIHITTYSTTINGNININNKQKGTTKSNNRCADIFLSKHTLYKYIDLCMLI